LYGITLENHNIAIENIMMARAVWRLLQAIFVIVLAIDHAAAGHAESQICLPYEPETVVLMGVVQRGLAYGPPGYGKTPYLDAKEVFYSLYLANPICVMGGDELDQPAEPTIRNLQIAFIKTPFDRALLEHRVRIVGTLFHGMTGHHHTKVLISPDQIERQ
jgi:Domain of unknown function (DUF4431)